MPAPSEISTALVLGGASVPASFSYNIDSPTYHQEMLAYVILKNLQAKEIIAWTHRQANTTPQTVAYNAFISDDSEPLIEAIKDAIKDGLLDGFGKALIELLAAQDFNIILNPNSANIEWRAQ